MTFYSVNNPFMQVFNLRGTGLNDGDIYFGQPGQDPEIYPQTVYWDVGGADVAAQPITTTGGYLWRSGSPAALYVAGAYSIRVRDKNGTEIYYQQEVNDLLYDFAGPDGANLIGFSLDTAATTGTDGETAYFSQTLIATAGQTVFTISQPVQGIPHVHLNGILLTPNVSPALYTVAGTTLTITSACLLGDEIFYEDFNYEADPNATPTAGTVAGKLQQLPNPLDYPYNAVGDGLANDRNALAALSAARPMFITANHRIGSNVTFTNLVTFMGEGRLTIDVGVVVTFAGGINSANDNRIFYGEGTIDGLREFWAEWITDANDSTDDTDNLNKAIACVGPRGVLYMGAGPWKVTDEIGIAEDHVSVAGSGRLVTRIKQYSPEMRVFNVTADYFTPSEMSVEYVSQGTSGGDAFYFDGCAYSKADGIYVFRANLGIAYANDANSHECAQIKLENCTTAGLSINNAFNITFSQGQVLNSDTTTLCLEGCIRLTNKVEGCNFTDVQTYQGVNGLTMDADAYVFGQRPAYNKFTACYFDAATANVIQKSTEIDLINCWFSARPEYGLYIEESDGIRINGGQAINCGKDGLLIGPNSVRVSVIGFAARSNSVLTPNTYSGIAVAADVTDFLIQGCTATNSGITFGTQKYPIEIKAGASDRYNIVFNIISGNGAAGVSDGGTGVDKKVDWNY